MIQKKACIIRPMDKPVIISASDNLKSEKYKGLTPHDLIDIAMMNDLHYDGTHQEGVFFT